jgi:hypothetical protein
MTFSLIIELPVTFGIGQGREKEQTLVVGFFSFAILVRF